MQDNLTVGTVRLITFFRKYPFMAARLLLRIGGLPIDLPIYQKLILLIVWNKLSPIIVMTRGGGKTFIQAVIQLLNSLLYKRKKTGCIGPGFRQAKLVFEEIDNIIKESPLVKQAIYKGPTYKTDICYINWRHNGLINAIPLGDGNKVRGMRFHYIGVDELAQVPKDILDIVVRGFAATILDPMKNVRRIEKEKELESRGVNFKKSSSRQNQIAGFSTAFYQFNHLWTTIQNNITIIQSQFSKNKINSHDEYIVVKIPYNKLPEGFLSSHMIESAKNDMSEYEFAMEYNCFRYDTPILTNTGVKNISDIKIGDMVLTHKGRFKKVNNIMCREYSGDVIDYLSFGYNDRIVVTTNHKFYYKEDWIEISNLIKENYLNLVNLSKLNGLEEIDIKKYVDNYLISYVDNVEYIYPKPSQCNKYSCGKNKIFKSSVISNIKLDYYFGLILGWYASEGSIGANDKAISFSLDGHHDVKLDNFIKELENAIYKSFNKKIKKYYKDNVCNIVINSRLLAQLFKNICPGISDTKVIDPNILFSNLNLLYGFIVGYWHGDGCVNNKPQAIVGCVNKNLLMQVKLSLSYFNIPSSFRKSKGQRIEFIQGRKINAKPLYELSIKGDDARFFNKFIGNKFNLKERIGNNKPINITNNGMSSVFKIRDYKIYKYNGLVYNLSVDDDHSYSLPTATVHNCFFPSDSDGFFRMSLLDAAKSKRVVYKYKGDTNRNYILAIDPARQSDNCAFAIGEIGDDSEQDTIVCVETLNNKSFSVIHSKILDILDRYNIIGIVVDKGGGGTTIKDNLNDEEKMGNRSLIYDIDDENSYIGGLRSRPKKGLHLLKLINFNPTWISEANHNLLADLEHKRLVFAREPNDIENETMSEVELAWLETQNEEMLEAKKEMSRIVVTVTNRGYPHWDTQNKKDRKDRYSAILILNDEFRRLKVNKKDQNNNTIANGGWASEFNKGNDNYFDSAALV
jgi:hypothetical protein